MNRTYVDADAGDGNGSHYEGNGNRHTLGVGVEVSLTYSEEHTHNSAESDGKHNLENGIDKHGNNVNDTGVNGLSDTEGNRENDKTYRVVKSNYGKEEVGERTLSLILLYNHEGCRGSGCSSYCTEYDSGGKGEHVIANTKGEGDENDIHNDAGEESLEDTDNGSLAADLLKLRDSELVTDRKGDEAESEIAEDLVVVRFVVDIIKADTEFSKEEGADKNARDKVCSNSGESEKLYNSGEHKSGEQSNGQCQKYRGGHLLFLLS